MATFIFKMNNEEIGFDGLTHGPIKDLFENLRTTIAHQLQSMQCEIHHLEPVVVLESDGKKVTVAGFGTCCRDFGNTLRDRIKLPEWALSSNVVITTEN